MIAVRRLVFPQKRQSPICCSRETVILLASTSLPDLKARSVGQVPPDSLDLPNRLPVKKRRLHRPLVQMNLRRRGGSSTLYRALLASSRLRGGGAACCSTRLKPLAAGHNAKAVHECQNERRLQAALQDGLPLRRVVDRQSDAPVVREGGLRAVAQQLVNELAVDEGKPVGRASGGGAGLADWHEDTPLAWAAAPQENGPRAVDEERRQDTEIALVRR